MRDSGTVWAPETEQVAFDFSVGELASRVAPFAARVAEERQAAGDMDADDWYDLGFDLEAVAVDEAHRAYREALRLDPGHPDALVNVGRLLHEAGRVDEAEGRYRAALEADPEHPLAHFNLGVALDDAGRVDEAAEAYRRALVCDPRLSSAHFNLARLLEASGDFQGTVRHLAAYKTLRDDDQRARG